MAAMEDTSGEDINPQYRLGIRRLAKSFYVNSNDDLVITDPFGLHEFARQKARERLLSK